MILKSEKGGTIFCLLEKTKISHLHKGERNIIKVQKNYIYYIIKEVK